MLVQGVRGSQSQPDSPSAQLALIAASQNFLQVPALSGASHTSSGTDITAFILCLAPLRHRLQVGIREMLRVCPLLMAFSFAPAARWEDGSCSQGHRPHHHGPSLRDAAQPVCQELGSGSGRAPHSCPEGERLGPILQQDMGGRWGWPGGRSRSLLQQCGLDGHPAHLPFFPIAGSGGVRTPGDRLRAGSGAEPGEGLAGSQGSCPRWQAQASAGRDGEGTEKGGVG